MPSRGILLFSMFFISCATPTYFMDKSYGNASTPNAELYVSPIRSNQIKIDLIKNFIEDFGLGGESDYASVMRDTFNFHFRRNIEECISKVSLAANSQTSPETKYFDDRQMLNPDSEDAKSFVFQIPDRESLKSQGISAQYVLVFQNLNFGYYYQAGINNTRSQYLSLFVEYELWDYNTGKAVGFGYTRGLASATFNTTKEDWIKIINQASNDIMKQTPFNSQKCNSRVNR